MTEHTERVERQKIKNEAEAWGKAWKYLHYNNGIEEIKYNNGNIKFTNVKTGEISYKYEKNYKLSLIDRFQRAMVDSIKRGF